MSVKVTKDNTAAIMKAISQLGKKDVLVGIPQSTASRPGSDINNAEIGYIQETGSPANNIPARPFLVPGVQDSQALIANQLGNGAKAALSGHPEVAANALNGAGMIGRNSVIRKVNTGPFAPNAPSTIAAKGSDKPLIDTRDMVRAITYVVRDK